jgi:hypothetical protein
MSEAGPPGPARHQPTTSAPPYRPPASDSARRVAAPTAASGARSTTVTRGTTGSPALARRNGHGRTLRPPGSAQSMGETGADRLRRRAEERSQAAGRRLWPDQVYLDAVWDSSELTSTQKIAAMCYSNHARAHPDRDRAWVSPRERFMTQTGIRSTETVATVKESLVRAGWLEPAGPLPRHRQILVYRLALPETGTEIATGTDFRTGSSRAGTGSVAAGSGTEIEPEPVRKSGKPVRKPNGTGAESGPQLSFGEDPPRDSPKEPARRDAAATLRAAEPGEEQTVDAGEPSMTAEEAKAQLSVLLADKRRARTSRWAPRHRGEAVPNPLFDPAAAARLAADEPDEPA